MNPFNMGKKVKIWFVGMRSPFLIASAVPVIFAGALAYEKTGLFDWPLFLMTLIGVVIMHAAANMTNEYFDFKNKTDVVNKNRTIFSGGSGLLVSGEIPVKQYRNVFLILYAVVLAIGLYIFLSLGNKGFTIIILALLGFFLTYFYSCPPIYFAHRGLGEIAVGLCFGPIPVLGAYLVITKTMSIIPVLASIPIAMLIIAVLWINQFPDTEADSYASKLNLVIRLGPKKARFGYYILMAATYVSTLLLVIFEILPVYCLLALLTSPIAVKASAILHKNFENPKGVFPAMGMTILNHHLTGLILTGGLLIEKFSK